MAETNDMNNTTTARGALYISAIQYRFQRKLNMMMYIIKHNIIFKKKPRKGDDLTAYFLLYA